MAWMDGFKVAHPSALRRTAGQTLVSKCIVSVAFPQLNMGLTVIEEHTKLDGVLAISILRAETNNVLLDLLHFLCSRGVCEHRGFP
jgi:hypothetical protein